MAATSSHDYTDPPTRAGGGGSFDFSCPGASRDTSTTAPSSAAGGIAAAALSVSWHLASVFSRSSSVQVSTTAGIRDAVVANYGSI